MSIILELLGIVIGIAILVAMMIIIGWLTERTQYATKRDKFDWYYTKHLLAYKIKVLKDELLKRHVKMDEIHGIIGDALDAKTSRKHVLDKVEEEVKGEVKQASPKAFRKKPKKGK